MLNHSRQLHPKCLYSIFAQVKLSLYFGQNTFPFRYIECLSKGEHGQKNIYISREASDHKKTNQMFNQAMIYQIDFNSGGL